MERKYSMVGRARNAAWRHITVVVRPGFLYLREGNIGAVGSTEEIGCGRFVSSYEKSNVPRGSHAGLGLVHISLFTGSLSIHASPGHCVPRSRLGE